MGCLPGEVIGSKCWTFGWFPALESELLVEVDAGLVADWVFCDGCNDGLLLFLESFVESSLYSFFEVLGMSGYPDYEDFWIWGWDLDLTFFGVDYVSNNLTFFLTH